MDRTVDIIIDNTSKPPAMVIELHGVSHDLDRNLFIKYKIRETVIPIPIIAVLVAAKGKKDEVVIVIIPKNIVAMNILYDNFSM